MDHCVYYGDQIKEGQPEHLCQIHEKCVLRRGRRIASCDKCKQKLGYDDPKDDWIDPLIITNRYGEKHIAFRNMLAGGAAFLVCGGPSLKSVPHGWLKQRGVFSLGVNNVAAFAPVQAFVCSDPPLKFHHAIFTDPKIMSFVPTPKLRGSRAKLRRKLEDGTFETLQKMTRDCPNTWGVKRRGWLQLDDTWFTEESGSWGNMKEGARRGTGLEKTACTMLLGLRILQYMGARKIFLLGVDFNMDCNADLTDNYAFAEDRDQMAINSNNSQYRITNNWLCGLRPVFEKWGFFTYNCNQHSHLRAFDYVPFNKAIEICRGLVPKEPLDVRGFYGKVEKYVLPEN